MLLFYHPKRKAEYRERSDNVRTGVNVMHPSEKRMFLLNSKDDVGALTLPNPLEKGFLLVDGDVMLLLYTVSFENRVETDRL